MNDLPPAEEETEVSKFIDYAHSKGFDCSLVPSTRPEGVEFTRAATALLWHAWKQMSVITP